MKKSLCHYSYHRRIKEEEWDLKKFVVEAEKLVYQKAFRKGLTWIPAGHILRMSLSIIMEDEGHGHH